MIDAVNCPSPAFNVPGTSGFYAQMTGLLAGFAFTAIVLLLTPTQNVQREIAEGGTSRGSGQSRRADAITTETRINDNGLFLTLLAAFFALIIATLTYSVLAGETLPQARGRAATDELIDGVPFGIAIMMLFHGITLLLDNGNASRAAVWLSRIVAVGVAPVLTMFYLTNGATDMESARLAEHAPRAICSGVPAPPMLGIVLTGVLIVVLTMSMTVGRRVAIIRTRMRRLQVAPPVMVVAIGVIAAVLSGYVSSRPDRFLMSPELLNAYLIGTSAVLAFIGVILSAGGGREQAMMESKRSSETAARETPTPQ